MYLLIDPYRYPGFSFKDIRVMNAVAATLMDTYDEIDEGVLAQTIIRNYREGMASHALRTHVMREMKL